jgi:hypothetical protein
MNKSASKKRKSPTKEVSFADLDLDLETSSVRCDEEHNIEENYHSGSKKRMYTIPHAASLMRKETSKR